MPRLAKHELEELTTLIRQYYVKRFRRRKTPKYGSINKGFEEREVHDFFKTIDNDKFALLFKYQAFMGLRINEVVKLNIENISFDKRELTLYQSYYSTSFDNPFHIV